MKVCSGCKETKDSSLFSKRAMSPDGLQPRCKVCCSKRDHGYYLKNEDKIIQRTREWAIKNPVRAKELHRLAERKRRAKNPELHRLAVKKYSKNHPEKIKERELKRGPRTSEKDKQRRLRWAKKHPEKNSLCKRLAAKVRNKRVKQATPKWADLPAIKEFYKNCPKHCQVDHVIPLRGKNVSGLHVLNNLAYLTVEENLKKSNKFVEKR